MRTDAPTPPPSRVVLLFLRSAHYTASHSSNLLHNTPALAPSLPYPIPLALPYPIPQALPYPIPPALPYPTPPALTNIFWSHLPINNLLLNPCFEPQ